MAATPVIRIIIADDHRLFLDGLRRLFEEQPDLQVIGTTANGHDAIEAVVRERPDILLTDIDMPDLNAFTVADRIKERGITDLRIILLTMHNETPYLLAASRPDIHGFVLKDCAFEELVHAVRAVYAGERFSSKTLGEPLGEKPPLTEREMQVLDCAAEGLTIPQTADRLGIGVKTVETHRSHIITKLKVPNITRATHIVRHF
jgi:DNA-binding NarL/FixJ family response regulator